MSTLKNEYKCSLILVNDLLGGKWKYRIMWHIINGDNRFCLLEKSIPDITHKMLTTQLKELETSGILIRKDFNEYPHHVEYSLSPEYKSIIPILDSLCEFAKHYAYVNDIKIPD